MNTKTINLHKITQENLSPKEFLNLKSGDSRNISHTEVVPARLGQKSFGSIKVHYKNAVYK
jgi:hypothetical protein